MVKHKTRVTNRVTDAFSQRNNLLTAMRLEESGFDLFRDLLDIDPYFSAIMSVVYEGEQSNFLLHDGFLFKGNQLCVRDRSLRLQILQELHGEGHVGRDCIFQFVRDSYFWSSMRKEVERVMERCQICQVAKGKATNAGFYMPYLFRLSLGLK